MEKENKGKNVPGRGIICAEGGRAWCVPGNAKNSRA